MIDYIEYFKHLECFESSNAHFRGSELAKHFKSGSHQKVKRKHLIKRIVKASSVTFSSARKDGAPFSRLPPPRCNCTRPLPIWVGCSTSQAAPRHNKHISYRPLALIFLSYLQLWMHNSFPFHFKCCHYLPRVGGEKKKKRLFLYLVISLNTKSIGFRRGSLEALPSFISPTPFLLPKLISSVIKNYMF